MGSAPLYQHIFYRHLLGLQHQAPQAREAYVLVWPSVFLLSCFLLLVLIKVTSFSKVIKVVQSCFSMQTLRQLEREEYNPFKFYSVALSLFFILNLAFFIYKVNEIYGQVLTGYSRALQFLFFLLITLLVFVARNGLSRVLAIGIGDHRLIPEYSYSSYIISQTLGILLFPCLVFAELSHFNPLVFLSAASVILLSMQVFKWYRGIVFALVENRVGLLQIFTYFCSLEILPVLVLVKFIIEKF
jgi:hypothetical protein